MNSTGRGIPDGGTNYSGILECPCTSNYAGDPQFYGKDTKTKQVTHRYSAIAQGVCSTNDKLDSADECFATAPLIGFNATHYVNATVSAHTSVHNCRLLSPSLV